MKISSFQESKPILKCGWNSEWIKDCFGESMLNSVGKNGIICSGVSVGSRDSVMEYTKTMSNIILHSAIVSDYDRFFLISL